MDHLIKIFFLRLNLAIGGNYIDAPWNDAHNSVGAADDFPATMSVDYVRVYEMRNPKRLKSRHATAQVA